MLLGHNKEQTIGTCTYAGDSQGQCAEEEKGQSYVIAFTERSWNVSEIMEMKSIPKDADIRRIQWLQRGFTREFFVVMGELCLIGMVSVQICTEIKWHRTIHMLYELLSCLWKYMTVIQLSVGENWGIHVSFPYCLCNFWIHLYIFQIKKFS